MTIKNPQTCLSAELLRQLSQDELSPAELKDVEDHVSDCERCRQLLEVPVSDPQWQDEIVPILRTPLESPHVAGDHNDRSTEGESLESILRLLGPTDDPHMLGRIGSYEVVGVIGRGGMGVVFKAFEPALNRFVAIKMLLPHLAASGAARKRFAREGKAAAAVIDDNVMPIYSVAEWQGVPYLVTQYSRGATLQRRIQDQGPLELNEILRIGMQTARGLAAAHAQGLVHRDVKPSNILLDGTVERALLTDFGLARAVDDASITKTGIIAGTPQYMSPEQARGGSVDARSDLFGLGCVLYAMCTGRPPFRADSSYAILRMITDDEPRSIREINPDIPEWLCLLISRLMAKSPDARFGNALEVAALLEQCLAHVQKPTSVPLPASLVPHAAGRRSIFNVTRKGVIAMLGTLGMTLLGLVLLQATEAPDINGQWASDEWGTVVLEAKEPGQYEGTFTGSDKDKPATDNQINRDVRVPDGGTVLMGTPHNAFAKGKSGTVHLKWSRVERRFNGTWGKGGDRNGTMSLRLVDKEIRGGWTTDEDVQLASGTPLLGDLLWTRSQEEVGQAIAAPGLTEAAQGLNGTKTASVAESMHIKLPATKENGEYRVTLLGITRVVAPEFTTGDELSVGNRPVSWMRAIAMIERLGEMNGPYGFDAQATDRQKQIENLKVRSTTELDLNSSHLARELSPIPVPKSAPSARGKIYIFTVCGVFQAADLATLRFQFGTPGQQQELLFENVQIPAIEKVPGIEQPLDRQNARSVVEAFVAAALAGDSETVITLAMLNRRDLKRPTERIENMITYLPDREHLPMTSVHVNDAENPTDAIAISKQFKWEHPSSERKTDVVAWFTLSMSEAGWIVTNISFEWIESTDGLLKKFLEANPKSTSVLPLTPMSLTEKPAGVLTAEQAIKNGKDLLDSQKKVVVRFRVLHASLTQRIGGGIMWELRSAENFDRGGPDVRFTVQVSPQVAAPLKQRGVDDLEKQFVGYVGKAIEVEGVISQLSLPGVIGDYGIRVTSLDQIRIVDLDNSKNAPAVAESDQDTEVPGAAKAPGIEEPLDRQNARSVVEACIAAVLAGNGDEPTGLNNPTEGSELQFFSSLFDIQPYALGVVYVNDPAKPTTALATCKLQLKEPQPDGQRDGCLVVTVTMSDAGWGLSDFDIESDEGAQNKLKSFLETYPNAAIIPPTLKGSQVIQQGKASRQSKESVEVQTQQIFDRLRKHFEFVDTLAVEWKQTVTYSAGSREGKDLRRKDESGRSFPGKTAEVTNDCRVVIKGGKWRYETIGVQWQSELEQFAATEDIATSNGTYCVSFVGIDAPDRKSPGQAFVYHSVDTPSRARLPQAAPVIAFSRPFQVPIGTLLQSGPSPPTVRQTEDNRSIELVFEIPGQPREKEALYRVYSDRPWLLRYMSYGGRLELDVHYHADTDQAPSGWTCTERNPDGSFSTMINAEVTSWEVNVPVDDGEFTMKLPPGTRVWDRTGLSDVRKYWEAGSDSEPASEAVNNALSIESPGDSGKNERTR